MGRVGWMIVTSQRRMSVWILEQWKRCRVAMCAMDCKRWGEVMRINSGSLYEEHISLPGTNEWRDQTGETCLQSWSRAFALVRVCNGRRRLETWDFRRHLVLGDALPLLGSLYVMRNVNLWGESRQWSWLIVVGCEHWRGMKGNMCSGRFIYGDGTD